MEAALERLLELSLKMEEKGPEAAEAAEALSAPRALLDEHKQRVLGGEYTDVTERLEAFSLRVCALVQLEHADAAAAVGTTDAAERLALVAAALRDAVGELDARGPRSDRARHLGRAIGGRRRRRRVRRRRGSRRWTSRSARRMRARRRRRSCPRARASSLVE